MNKNFFLIIVVLTFVTLGCKRNKGVCGLPYENAKFDHARFDYSIIDTIIHEDPNQYIFSGKILIKKEPLIGANIWISNTTIGTVTDINGVFYFKFQPTEAQDLDSLFVNFDYTGYQSLKVELKKLINQEIMVRVIDL